MERSVGAKLPNSLFLVFRRALLIFLAFTYLFVGLVQTVSCEVDAVASIVSSKLDNPLDVGLVHVDPKEVPAVAGHCHFCAPLMMPVFASVLLPSARLITLLYVLPLTQFDRHPRLDTPPPRLSA